MHQAPAALMAASFALGLLAGAARAECRQELLACESRCSDMRDDAKTDCTARRCRSIVICEAEPRRAAARDKLPASALPTGSLPTGHLPGSRLPDSFRN
ncbi:MAG: hypothetical protein AB7S92_22475 [Parvibaculaceae bacterium]